MTANRSWLWRGALKGGIVGLVLLFFIVVGSFFIPPAPQTPGPMILPSFSRGSDLFAAAAFLLLSMGIGAIVAFIWSRAAGGRRGD